MICFLNRPFKSKRRRGKERTTNNLKIKKICAKKYWNNSFVTLVLVMSLFPLDEFDRHFSEAEHSIHGCWKN